MKDHITMNRAKSLANDLFSLSEPWRSRFLDLVTSQATTDCAWSEQSLTRGQVTIWLSDCDLYQHVTLLLHAWQRV